MIPTHAAIMSQTLALECLRSHYPLDGPDAYYPKRLPGKYYCIQSSVILLLRYSYYYS